MQPFTPRPEDTLRVLGRRSGNYTTQVLAAWVKGFAKAANQGPFGQFQLAETTFPPHAGGAPKDAEGGWYEAASRGSMNLVIDIIFGADLTLYNGIQGHSRLMDFAPAAPLLTLNYLGRNFTISSEEFSRCRHL